MHFVRLKICRRWLNSLPSWWALILSIQPAICGDSRWPMKQMVLILVSSFMNSSDQVWLLNRFWDNDATSSKNVWALFFWIWDRPLPYSMYFILRNLLRVRSMDFMKTSRLTCLPHDIFTKAFLYGLALQGWVVFISSSTWPLEVNSWEDWVLDVILLFTTISFT